VSSSQHQPVGDDLHRWVEAQVAALGVDPSAVDVDVLLDLARDVAHGVARPAVPLTTFLAGYAVGAGTGDRAALDAVVARLTAEAARWGGTPGAAGSGDAAAPGAGRAQEAP
jgi:hypothetical protein